MASTLEEVLGFTDTTNTRPVLTAIINSHSPNGATVTLKASNKKAVLPISESPLAKLPPVGKEVQVLLLEDGDLPIVSLTHPELISSMLAGIVPEIRSGGIRVMGVSRLPGVRAKVSVASTTPDKNPIPVIVGPGANRVKYLAEHLNGERVDVIMWNEDRPALLRNAFAPAEISDVLIDEKKRLAAVSVEPHRMSAAVGAGGLNASLAGRLAGMRVTAVPVGASLEDALHDLEKEQAEAN